MKLQLARCLAVPSSTSSSLRVLDRIDWPADRGLCLRLLLDAPRRECQRADRVHDLTEYFPVSPVVRTFARRV